MSLTADEKTLVHEALQVYIQLATQQMGEQRAQGMAQMARDVILKLDNLGIGETNGGKPIGISDEWFDNVCNTCDLLSPNGCEDKVTGKFPGKCDPILKFERQKFLAARQSTV